MTNEQSREIEPTRPPKKLELELSTETMEWLSATAQRTGRSEEELILEILDKALKGRQQSHNRAKRWQAWQPDAPSDKNAHLSTRIITELYVSSMVYRQIKRHTEDVRHRRDPWSMQTTRQAL